MFALMRGCVAMPPAHEVEAPPRPAASGFQVLMINGGGSPAGNYQSHHLHLRRLVELLGATGVPPADVTIFSGDGDDPQPDMAVREAHAEHEFELLEGTRLESTLVLPTTLANTSLPGFRLHPATKAGITAWFEDAKRRLHAGDTLLVYVTDHGTKNAEDVGDNKITLWGQGETLSVHELRALIDTLDPDVHVVALMSQCFSGAFANLMAAHGGDRVPRGQVCGYFSSTAERPAYGCYPENRGRKNVGHSVRFIEALASTGSFATAHTHVLVTDATPDVPLRTSDVYLEQRLRAVAAARGVLLPALVDEELKVAWQNRAEWEPEIRLLDRIGHTYGFFSPRSLAELDDQSQRLSAIAEPLRNYSKAWKASCADLTTANLAHFLLANPAWKERVDEKNVAGITPAAARTLAEALVADLGPFTDRATERRARLRVLRHKAQASGATSYRMEVREAVMLRMRALLTTIAGRVYVAREGTPEERASYDALRACEDLRLPGPLPTAALPPDPEPFPPYDEDVKLTSSLLPAWIGIQFRQATEESRRQHDLPEGASAVVTIYPSSPAEAAGLLGGDIVLGPPGAFFADPGQIREWTMLSKPGEPRRLVVLRGDDRREVTLVPKPFPGKWPELAGPPKVGAAAPAIQLVGYRGDVPASLAGASPHLLFFWATWCGPCKASLPEVLAFEQVRRTPVVAITDEARTQLDAFFAKFGQPFPATVAIDEYRRSFVAYGVSGTPTFVLVDGQGTVQGYASGYDAKKGLPLAGWTWAGRPIAASE
jgi:thiol-disulfide isomerase/thioredoxin